MGAQSSIQQTGGSPNRPAKGRRLNPLEHRNVLNLSQVRDNIDHVDKINAEKNDKFLKNDEVISAHLDRLRALRDQMHANPIVQVDFKHQNRG